MDFNKKNLQDKLNTPSRLPDELNWEHMEDGIYSKMEALKNSDSNSMKKRRRVLFWFFLSLTTFLFVFLLWQNKAEKDAPTVENAETFPSSGQASVKQIDRANNLLKDAGKTESRRTIIQNPAGETTNNTVEKVDIAADEMDNSAFNSTRVLNNQGGQGGITGISIDNNRLEKSNLPNPIVTGMKDDKGQAGVQQDVVVILPLGAMGIPAFPGRHTDLKLSPKDLSEEPEPGKKKLPAERAITLSGGISFWDFGYHSTAPERAPFEKNLLSYTTQVSYQHFIGRNLFLTSGLVYQQLESRLDWSEKVENYQITLENVITEIQTNALTGATEETRGNVEMDVEAERRVRHHNRSTLVQIPIGLGVVRDMGSFRWSMMAGASVNLFGNSRGRLVTQNTVVDYTASENPFFQPDWKINGYAETRLEYKLADRWRLSTTIGYQKAITNWSLEKDVRMRPQIFGLQVGVGYGF